MKALVVISAPFFFILYAIIFSISPLLSACLFVGLLYVALNIYRPFLIVLCFIFALAFPGLLNLPVTGGGLALSTFIVVSAFAIWAAKELLNKESNVLMHALKSPVFIIITAFLLVMVISLIMNSANKAAALKQIQKFIYCYVIFVYIGFNVKNKSQLDNIALYIFLGGSFVALIGLVESFTSNTIYFFLNNRSIFGADLTERLVVAHIGRINGPIGDSPFHGVYMMIVCSIAIYLFLTSSSKAFKIFLAGAFFLFLINIFGTASRGALLALIISMGVFSYYLKKVLYFTVFLTLIMTTFILMFLFFPNMNTERLFSTEAKATEPIRMRWTNMNVAFNIFSNHPFIGSGPDGFVINYHRYAAQRERTLATHNTLLQVLAEYGLIGVILFLSIFIYSVKNLLYVYKKSRDVRHKIFSVSLLSSLAGFMGFMITSNSLLDQNMWLLIALSQALYNVHRTGQLI